MALLEWTLSEVFDATDAEPLGRAALAAVNPADLGRRLDSKLIPRCAGSISAGTPRPFGRP